LLEIKNDEIDIFLSSGSSIVQMAWYICHTTLGLKTSLIQLKGQEYPTDSKKPDLINLEIEQSVIPVSAIIKQVNLSSEYIEDDILVTESVKPIYNKASKIAVTDCVNTMIFGNYGTGKELLAKYIHDNSVRKKKPFVTINCSAFPDHLLEAKLFGYKKGAFPGSEKDQKGVFDQANKGTVFLDEIADVSSYIQQSLLEVIREKQFKPLGGKTVQTDLRIIAATDKNLIKLCHEGKFRWDLYYNLATAELKLPDLAEYSTEEIKEFIEFMLKTKQKTFNKPEMLKLSNNAEEALLNYNYPGNIRELENIIENLYVFCDKNAELNDLPEMVNIKSPKSHMNWQFIEKEHIIRILDKFKGNLRDTSEMIGYSLNTLKSRLKKYDIDIDRWK
jgi:DNA-binding NtrC family response regulator